MRAVATPTPDTPPASVMLLRSLDELAPMTSRCFRGRSGRTLLLVRGREREVHALDAACAHRGGNLGAGDVEDLGGKLAVVCPDHNLKVSLVDGRCVSAGCGTLREGQLVQRIHRTQLAADGSVWVQLSSEHENGPLPSDVYNIARRPATVTAAYRARKALAEAAFSREKKTPGGAARPLVQTTLNDTWAAAAAAAAAAGAPLAAPPSHGISRGVPTTPSQFFGAS